MNLLQQAHDAGMSGIEYLDWLSAVKELKLKKDTFLMVSGNTDEFQYSLNALSLECKFHIVSVCLERANKIALLMITDIYADKS